MQRKQKGKPAEALKNRATELERENTELKRQKRLLEDPAATARAMFDTYLAEFE